MRIEPADHQAVRHHLAGLDKVRKSSSQPKVDAARLDEPTGADLPRITSLATKDSDALAKEPKDQADKVPGVIRLLEAGHFKGVADVRLVAVTE